MNQLSWLLRCGSLALALYCSPEASALDCAKAGTPVERAICAEPSLRAADTKLSERYFAALSRAKMIAEIVGQGSAHDRLLKSELSDGQTTYPAGTYTYELVITAK